MRHFFKKGLRAAAFSTVILAASGCISITTSDPLPTPTQGDFNRAAKNIREASDHLIKTYNGSVQGKICSDAREPAQVAKRRLQPTLQRFSDLFGFEGSEQFFGPIAAYPDTDVDLGALSRPEGGVVIQLTLENSANATAFSSGRINLSLGLIRAICEATEPKGILEDLRQKQNFEAPTLVANGEELFQLMEITSPMADLGIYSQVGFPAAQQEFLDALIFVLAHEHLHVYQLQGDQEYDHPKTKEILADVAGILLLESTRGQFAAEADAQAELEATLSWSETNPSVIANLFAAKGYVSVLENVYVRSGFRETSDDYLPVEERISLLEDFGRSLVSEE